MLRVVQESPSLDTPLISLVDTLVETIEPTHVGSSIEEVPRAMIEFPDDVCPQQVDEVLRYI